MRRIKMIAFALIALISLPSFASAADIPLLTWERGRQQQVVVAEGDLNRNWTVLLEGNGVDPIAFSGSKKDANGYVVFSLSIPNDFPLGSYSVSATPAGSEKTVIAGIFLIEAQTRTAASDLVDLTAIISIFVFLTAIASTIRSRKYRFIPFKSSQVLPRITDPILDDELNFWDRLEKAPYRLRIQWLNNFAPSLLRFILIRDGELAHRLNKNFYGISPLLGLLAGVIASIQVNKVGGVAATSTTLFLVVAAVGIFDTFAGLTATLGFWAVQVFTGNVSSFRDILISLSLGIAWIGPSLFASLLRESIGKDFTPKSDRGGDPIKLLGVLGSGLVGGLAFYLGQALLESIIYVEHPDLQIKAIHILLIAALLTVRGISDSFILDKATDIELRDESFVMARVISPVSALLIASSLLAFTYIWTRSFSNSCYVTLLFTLPYIFSFIRFDGFAKFRLEKLQRNIILEAVVLATITFVLFRQISLSPLILEKRVELLLILAGIAPAVHALLSAIYSSNEDKFSFERNPEII
jgi:hypothetical protein